MPKVSICIPAYNYAHFITDAITSVLAQTFQNFELVVIDNCSTDDTKAVVDKFMSVDSRIIYICNETNIGPVRNLNRCLELATGDYIKILCADDLLPPTCIESMTAVLDQYPEVSLVASARKIVDGDLRSVRRVGYSFNAERIPGATAINTCLFNGNLIGEPSAVMFRKKDVSRGFNPEYAQLVDLEMWFHLLEQGGFVFLPEQLCVIRYHEAQGTKKNMNTFRFLVDEERLFKDYFSKPYISASYLKTQKYKFTTAWNIWQQRKACDDPVVVRSFMDRYINRYLFYALLLPAMVVNGILNTLNRLLVLRDGKTGKNE
jgi:glycosyltransferase involved in cell wall biosynthesis